jgi:isoleucyl-tRNA synthetase
MSDLRDKLVKNNKKINWEPAYIKDGRFGEFIREAKDWALSRERYWGAPLPIWACQKCQKRKIISSAEELKKIVDFSGNKYFLMRHGEAESNVKRIINSDIKNNHIKITEKGKKDVVKTAKKFKKEKIDLIFASDFLRTKETAEIMANEIGFEKSKIIYDERIRELNVGSFDNRRIDEYRNYFTTLLERFEKASPNGENLNQLKKRGMDFLQEIDKKFQNKNILIVGHLDPLWMMFVGAQGLNNEEALEKYGQEEKFLEKGDFISMLFYPLPRDENYILNLHRPFIDEIKLKCECGGEMEREKDVIDAWFDSGAMPFAQWGYPEAEGGEKELKNHYPADYISEAIDQTRGWFYTLLAVATLMEECGIISDGAPYKNVICLGHVLDAKGKKMSKSKGNVVSPWEMCEKFGADTLRWYLYTVNQAGDPKKFDVKDVQDKNRRVFGTLWNSLVFFQTYANKDFALNKNRSENILDKWIISVFNSVSGEAINCLEKYDVVSAARAIENFIDDLSNWFIRRSRERFQRSRSAEEKNEATQTLYFVLLELSKLIAPFAPFIAEHIYQRLAISDKRLAVIESVHLCDYPKPDKKLIDKKLEEQMKQVREIVAKGLALRMEKKIKIRQPLAELRIKNLELRKEKTLIDLIKDELNVKNVVLDKNIKDEIELDTEITKELKEEGLARELVRQIQQMRKEAGLVPQDMISIKYKVSSIKHKELFKMWSDFIKKETNAKSFEESKDSEKFDLEKEINLDGESIKVGIRKL